MSFCIKPKYNSVFCLLAFAAVVALCSILTAIFPAAWFLISPIFISALTVLFLLEHEKRPIASLVMSLFAVVLEMLLSGLSSFLSLATVILSIVVYFAFTRSILSKGEVAIVSTLILSLAFGLMMLFDIFHEIGSYDIAAALEFLSDTIAQAREVFVSSFEDAIEKYKDSFADNSNSELVQLFTPELIGEVFDAYTQIFISVVVIFAFLIVGTSFKLFKLFFGSIIEDRKSLDAWRFELSSVFAFSYVILYILSVFLVGDDVLSITVLNLTNVFTFIFAYLGFVTLGKLFTMRFRSAALAYLMLFGAVFLLYQFAINILAIIGVFAMIALDRARASGTGDFKK